MKIGAIIQARMTSTRLPGKVLKHVYQNLTMLEAVIQRVNACPEIDQIIIATTINKTDSPIISLCHKLKSKYPKLVTYRGSEHNVLSRFYFAAQKYDLDHIIRITSDCPLIDPYVISHMIHLYRQQINNNQEGCDYLSNVVKRTFPRGLDLEIFRFRSLEVAFFDLEVTPDEQEHVTAYIYGRPNLFKIRSYEQPEDLSQYRLTVDTVEDLKLIKMIYIALWPTYQNKFYQNEIIATLKEHPEWLLLNQNIEQKFHSQKHYQAKLTK